MSAVPLVEAWIWTIVRAEWCDRCSQSLNGRAAVKPAMRRTLCASCVLDLELAPLDVHAPLERPGRPLEF